MLDVNRPGPDYTLRWPRELLVQEAGALLVADPTPGQVEWLLEEAFAGSTPGTDFRASIASSSWIEPAGDAAGKPFLQDLIKAGPRLPERTAPRPYYAARHGRQLDERDRRPDPAAARRDWLAAVSALRRNGYLARLAPEVCVDGAPDDPDPDVVIDGEIADRLGVSGLWKERARADWDDAIFYSLVEVLHDLVERPRSRELHPYGNCGWHYSDFAPYPAQVLYRWTVNRVLARHHIDLILAKSGEDVGRLVHQPHDGRADLVESVVGVADPAARPTVEHALALFRRRGATREDKRSACVALAGLLEERRALLKDRLTRKDEGALFQIANEFAVRHRNAKQYADYDEAYLDWLFWWYLATFELTDKLLRRLGSATS